MATTERDVPIGELASSRDESAAVMQQKQAAMGAEGIPADVTSLSEKLQNNTKRFLLDLCSGLNRDMAPNLSMEELQKMAVWVRAVGCQGRRRSSARVTLALGAVRCAGACAGTRQGVQGAAWTGRGRLIWLGCRSYIFAVTLWSQAICIEVP